MFSMLEKIGIKSKSDNSKLQEGKQIPANNTHLKVTFSPQKKLNNPQAHSTDYGVNKNRKSTCDQYKKNKEKPLRSDRSTDSLPLRLSDPCVVQWKNRNVYVYTVESGQEKSAYPDLEFVIYIPVDTPVEWNLPTGVISTQTVSSTDKQKRGKRQEKHETSESEDHEKHTGKQWEDKINESSDAERETAPTHKHDANKSQNEPNSSRSGTDDENKTTDRIVQFHIPEKK